MVKENMGMEKLTSLFEPGRIGKLEIKNRIISAPLGMGFNFGTKPNGFVTDRLIAYNEARAKGGVGMIQLNTSAVARPYASSLLFGPGVLGLRTRRAYPRRSEDDEGDSRSWDQDFLFTGLYRSDHGPHDSPQTPATGIS